MHTLMTPAQSLARDLVVRHRIARSPSLRLAAWHLTQLIGHAHGAVTGADPTASAAALHRQYPALQALLVKRLAIQPVATVHTVDRTLTELVVQQVGADGAGGTQDDATDPGSLDAWASHLAGALVAA